MRPTRAQIADRLRQVGQQAGVPFQADDINRLTDIVEAAYQRQPAQAGAVPGEAVTYGQPVTVEVPGQGRFTGVVIHRG